MIVHRIDGAIMKFVEHESGLYIYSANNDKYKQSGYQIHYDINCSTTKKMFSHREIQGADHARVLYQKLGRPVEEEFQHFEHQFPPELSGH
jgi:hypothetical protein